MRAQIVVSKENEASQNIKSALLSLAKYDDCGDGRYAAAGFDIVEYDGRITDIVPTVDADYYIYASTHRSESGKPALTVHTPGNWGEALLGGKSRSLNIAYGSKVAAIAREMKKLSDQSIAWPVNIEVDHHGPTIGKPLLFAEIGSGEGQWSNKEAGMIVAKAILAGIATHDSETARIGFGGTHYCSKFGKKVVDDGAVFGHIISGYALERDGADEEMIMQALGRNVEKIECAEIDWKGIKGEARGKLIAALESLKIKWERA